MIDDPTNKPYALAVDQFKTTVMKNDVHLTEHEVNNRFWSSRIQRIDSQFSTNRFRRVQVLSGTKFTNILKNEPSHHDYFQKKWRLMNIKYLKVASWRLMNIKYLKVSSSLTASSRAVMK
jgi:hypothetical protein